ncbi:MAG: serine hydrolase [Methanobacterium sp.]|nr:MAG: serine hydrolase [Methanobacterium sp.]
MMGGILLNIKIIGGLALICVIIVVAGVLFYNSNNQGADNKTKNSTNTVNNTTNTSTNQLSLSLSVNNQPNPSPSPGPGPSPGPTPPGPTPDPMDHTISLFDQYVKSTFLKASNAGLPGAAVVLIYKGRIVSINTLGVRDLESGLPVTPDTLFLLASVTKTFTATNVAQQVDKGLMRWNDTVKSYFNDPDEFYLYDPVAYDNLTIADCLKHTSGIPDAEGDMEAFWFNNSYSHMLYNLRFVQNTSTLGNTHQYNNVMYALGGYCAALANNKSWDQLIKTELLNPLGMNTATTNVYDFLNSPNHATHYISYYNDSGALITTPSYPPALDEIGPAGSMGASINQLVNWLKFQINDNGMFNGIKIISKNVLDTTKTGYVYMDDNNDTMYGYGWYVDKTHISHAGTIPSSKTFINFYPSTGIGLAILTNEGCWGDAFRYSVYKKFIDLLKGDKNTDPWPIYYDTYKPVYIPPPDNPTEPGELTNYDGVYFNNFYGNITIKLEKNNLICYYGNNTLPYSLNHWNNTMFTVRGTGDIITFKNLTSGKYQQVITYMAPDYMVIPKNVTGTFNRTE